MDKSAFELIYDVVKQIPKGKVATNPDPEHIPCHRVVNRMGEVSRAFVFGGANRQVELLRNEGVQVEDGRVDLEIYRWNRVTMEMME